MTLKNLLLNPTIQRIQTQIHKIDPKAPWVVKPVQKYFPNRIPNGNALGPIDRPH